MHQSLNFPDPFLRFTKKNTEKLLQIQLVAFIDTNLGCISFLSHSDMQLHGGVQ